VCSACGAGPAAVGMTAITRLPSGDMSNPWRQPP
jgi:hypothetical protein